MRKILIIEDDILVCDLLRIKLSSLGYQICVAHDGIDGLRAVTKNAPHLVLLDQMMPAMSGNEFLMRLKKRPRVHSIPVIMLSARFDNAEIAAAKKLGAVAYITKPFSLPHLIETIEKHLPKESDPARLAKPVAATAAALSAIVSPAAAQTAGPTLENAIQSHDDGDHLTASIMMQSLTETEPENADAWLRYGIELGHLEEFDKAENALLTAKTLAPGYADVDEALSNVRRWRERQEQNIAGPVAQDNSALLPDDDGAEPQLAITVSRSASKVRNNPDANWRDHSLVAAYAPNRKSAYLAQIDFNQRFGLKDTSVMLQGEWRLGKSAAAYSGVIATPKADFREKWGVRAGASIVVTKGIEASLDTRISNFGNATVGAATPKLSVTLPKNIGTVTGGFINLWDENGKRRSGWSLRGLNQPAEKLAIFGGYASYPETEAGRTFKTKAAHIGARYDISQNVRLSAVFEDERRSTGGRRSSFAVSLRFRL